jgi:hypothetical protein
MLKIVFYIWKYELILYADEYHQKHAHILMYVCYNIDFDLRNIQVTQYLPGTEQLHKSGSFCT